MEVPLQYKGWTDKAFSHVCLDGMTANFAEVEIPGVTDVDIAARIVPAAKELLIAMGMEIVPINDACEVLYVFTISMDAGGKTEYRPNGDVCTAYTETALMGDFIVMAPPVGGDGFVISLHSKHKVPEVSYTCNQTIEPPYDKVWPKAVVEAFYKVYGEGCTSGSYYNTSPQALR